MQEQGLIYNNYTFNQTNKTKYYTFIENQQIKHIQLYQYFLLTNIKCDSNIYQNVFRQLEKKVSRAYKP